MWKRNQRLLDKDGGTGGDGTGGAAGGGGTGGDGKGTPGPWYGAETNKPLVEGKGFKSIDDVFAWGTNAEKLIGADRAGRTVVLPKDDKDEEGRKAYFAKIGVPESHDKYELEVPEGEGKEFASAAAQEFHKLGVPKSAAQGIVKWFNGFIGKLVTDGEAGMKTESEKQLTALKGEWAADFDKNSEFARRFAKSSGLSDEDMGRVEAALGTAKMLKTFQKWGASIGEHGFSGSDGNNNGMTQAKAKEKIADLKLKRTGGEMTQEEYLKQMDILGPIAAQGT